jgi:acetyltransferase-like isoleucine patch superfamily enzyme
MVILPNNNINPLKYLIFTYIRKIYTFVDRWRWHSYYSSISKRFKYFGKNISFDYGIIFHGEKNISIGDNVFIGRNVLVNAAKGGTIDIGNSAGIGANSTLLTFSSDLLYNRDLEWKTGKGIVLKSIKIGKGVDIGYNVTINPGITLGNGCFVAAGSVVTQNVNEFEIVAGVPATIVGIRKEKYKEK